MEQKLFNVQCHGPNWRLRVRLAYLEEDVKELIMSLML